MPRLQKQSPAVHYNKNMEKKREQKSKTEVVGDRNSGKAKTSRVCQRRMLDHKGVLLLILVVSVILNGARYPKLGVH